MDIPEEVKAVADMVAGPRISLGAWRLMVKEISSEMMAIISRVVCSSVCCLHLWLTWNRDI